MNNLKRKKINFTAIFMSIVILVFGLLAIYFVGFVLQLENSKENFEVIQEKTVIGDSTELSAYFPDCSLLNKNCLDIKCKQYFLCNDEKYSRCEIYDCGENYGIGMIDENGQVKIQRKIKQDKKKLIEKIKKCTGNLEIISKNCVDDKLTIKAKVVTNGNCEIGGFLAVYEDENGENDLIKQASFFGLDNNFYTLSLVSCKSVKSFIAVSKNGINIEEIKK